MKLMDKIKERLNLRRKIDTVIDRALQESEYYEPQSDEFRAIMESINVATDARQKLETSKRKIDPNTVINVVAAIVLVLITMKYEEVSCYTTKAVTWIRRLF